VRVKGKVGIDGELTIPEHQRSEIVKVAARAFVLSLGFGGMAWMYLFAADAIRGGSWPSGLAYILLAAGLLVASLLVQRSLASAWLFHLMSFLCAVPPLLLLLDAGLRLTRVALGEGWLHAFGAVAVGLIGGVALQASSTQKRQEELARLSPISRARDSSQIWDLSSPNLDAWGGPTNRAGGRRMWLLIAPLLPAVGFALSRNRSEDFRILAATYILLLLALTWPWMYARQLGLAMHVRRLNASLQVRAGLQS
jgi:hypothetical protein